MHPLLILMGKALIDSLPGMAPQMSWTSVNLLYNAVRPFQNHYEELLTHDSYIPNRAAVNISNVPRRNRNSVPKRIA